MRDIREILTSPRHLRATRGGPSASPDAEPAPDLARSLERLRSAIAHHLCDCRADGAMLERVLDETKAVVQRADLRDGGSEKPDSARRREWRRNLETYIDEPELRNAPLFY